MKRTILPLVVGLLVSFGCRTIPGQDVRFEPTPMSVVRAMLELADVGSRDVVYDLGSGDGRIPITAAREFGAGGVGIEIHPALVARAQANAREAGASGTEPEAAAEAPLRAAGGFARRFLRLGHG